MSGIKFIAISILLITLMFTAFLFLRNYVYPRIVNTPFGGMVFFGIFLGVFTVVIAITYLLLKLMLVPPSAYA